MAFWQHDCTNRLGPVAGAGGDVDLWTGLANVYYDIDIGLSLMPYIGGGIGVARYSADLAAPGGPALNDSDTVFAYQVSAGLGYAITPSTTIFGGYRYLATQDPEISSAGANIETEYQSHNAQVGVRFGF